MPRPPKPPSPPLPSKDTSQRFKVIYIAGKYRDNRGEWHIRENIRAAERAAQVVWQYGGVALCPHKNTAFLGGLPGCPDDVWLNGDLELLRRCDALWAIENWKDSSGATAEVAFARAHQISVLFTHQEVIDYLKGKRAEKKIMDRIYDRLMG